MPIEVDGTLVSISGYHELLAVHKALMEAKFNPHYSDPAVAASPFVAALAHSIVDALQYEAEQRRSGPDWEQWRTLDESRREYTIILSRIRQQRCEQMSDEVLKLYLEYLVSPFRVGERVMRILLLASREPRENDSPPSG